MLPTPPALWLAAALALPQDPQMPSGGIQDAPADLPTVVVTPTGSARKAVETPFALELLGAETLLQRTYRTTPQVLRDVPGVMVQETAQGQGSPYIRGFTGFQTLLLVDGVRLNNSVFRAGPNQYWNTLDPLSVERFELVKGPSSVLYGSDAIGGTLQAFTKRPYADSSTPWAGELYWRTSSAEESHVARAEVSAALGERSGLLVGLTGKEFGDVQGGRDTGTQENTGYDEYDADVKLEHALSSDSRLTFLHQRVRQNNVPRTHRTIFAVPFEGTDVGSELRRDLDQERELTYLAWEAGALEGPFEQARATLSWHEQEETRDRIRPPSGGAGPNRRDLQGFDVGTLGASLEGTSAQTSLGTFSVGASFYRDDVDSFRRNLADPDNPADAIQGPVADDATYDLFGLFAQDEFALSERLDLTLGARLNHAAVNARSVRDPQTDTRFSIRDDWTTLVGSARFSYDVGDEGGAHVFGGLSQGFRAPNLSDLTRFDSARSDEFEVPAEGLEPERYLSYELGLKLEGEGTSAQIAAFYTSIQDPILRVPTGNVNADGEAEVQNRNVGDGHVLGIELAASVDLARDWSLFGHTTLLDGEVDTFPTSAPSSSREPLDRLMPWTTEAGLRYERGARGPWAETLAIYADDADELSTRDASDTTRIPPGGTPGYFVWDVRGGWQVSSALDVTLAVENLLDRDYRVHGSGQNRPGRGVLLGLRLRF